MSDAYEPAQCPVCHHPDAVAIVDRDGIRRELEHLWQYHLRRVRPDTPPQCLTDRTIFTQRPPLHLARCVTCGTVYRNPREREPVLAAAYADAGTDAAALRALFRAQRASFRRQARRLTRFRGRAGTGLEVGSYTGAFLAAARKEGWSFEGLDIDEGANCFARRLGFRVTRGTLEDYAQGRSFDAVAIWNCFEQLPDPRAAARTAHSILAPGGVLAVRVPNGAFYAAVRPQLDGPASRLARGVLAQNNFLGFPYRYAFTPAALTLLLRDAGFNVVSIVPEVLLPTPGEWTRGWAAWEQSAIRAVVRAVAVRGPPPWLEIYARAIASA